LLISDNGLDIIFWFDIQSTWWASQPSEDDIENWNNVLAHYILCEVTVHDLSEALTFYMQDKKTDDIEASVKGVLQEDYKTLGALIQRTVLTRLNRLISYARNVKGQYWLLEYPVDTDRLSSCFVKFEAVGRINGGKNFAFDPNGPECITVAMQGDERYISEDEWDEVIEFVGSERRAPLVLELLAGAEQLAGNGYQRGALTEAVTALEVALFEFAKRHQDNEELSERLGARMNAPHLKNQIKHMGLSGSINYLLPVILPDEVLPQNILKGCQEAVQKRQDVVHNGSRKVSHVSHYILSIRACCQILLGFYQEEEDSGAITAGL